MLPMLQRRRLPCRHDGTRSYSMLTRYAMLFAVRDARCRRFFFSAMLPRVTRQRGFVDTLSDAAAAAMRYAPALLFCAAADAEDAAPMLLLIISIHNRRMRHRI